MTKILEIEGVGESYAAKLAQAGIGSVEKLLAAGGTPKGRKELAEKTGISDALILRWVNHADLFRIKGIASEYSELLEVAGVDTVVELSKRKPENLYAKIVEVNTEHKKVRKLPTQAQIADWVKQAGELPRMVSY